MSRGRDPSFVKVQTPPQNKFVRKRSSFLQIGKHLPLHRVVAKARATDTTELTALGRVASIRWSTR